MKILFPAFILIFFAAGCKTGSTRTVILEEDRTITLLPDSSLASYSSLDVIHTGDGEDLVALYDHDHHAELFFDVNGKKHSSLSLEIPDSLVNESPPYTKATGSRSVFAVWSAMKTVFLFDEEGKLEKQVNATVPLIDNQQDYCLVAMNYCPVVLSGENIFVTCTRLDVIVRNPEARKKYFSTPPDIRMSISGDDQENFGVWPSEYRSGVPYRDYYPQRCSNGKGKMIYGFSASDTIYVLKNGKLVSSHECKSKFMTERRPYPDDSTGHFSFLEKYDVTEPRYTGLIFDPYRNYYYRIVHHAIEYEEPGGMTVHTYFDKPWSIMVLDEQFNVLNEIKMDQSRFIPVVFPVKEGMLIKKRQDKNAALPVCFSLFKIHE
jgi:hypothetical protein